MEKLLHERLRGYSYPFRNINIIEQREGVTTYAEMFKVWADEIERYYIPRPRLEDGTPLKNGDEIDYYGRAEKVVSYLVCGETRDDVDYGMLHAYATLNLKCGVSHNVPLDEPLKRPTPKVYDADGVVYEFGETVFNVKTGEEHIVESLDECAVKVNGDEIWWCNDCFTHERPVFDAEGVRICKGDTVWFASGKNIMSQIIQNIEPYEDDMCVVIDGLHYDPDQLTHKNTDSFERLLKDMSMYAACEGGGVEIKVEQFEDRLTALIERDER